MSAVPYEVKSTQLAQGVSETESIQFKFQAEGITCPSCVSTIENALHALTTSDVTVQAAADIFKKTVRVRVTGQVTKVTQDMITQAATDVGIDLEPIPEITETVSDDLKPIQEIKVVKSSEVGRHLIKGIVGSLVGLGLFIWSTVDMATAMLPLTMVLTVSISFFALLWAGWDTYKSAYRQAKGGRFSMDALFSASTIVIWSLSFVSLFVPLGMEMLLSSAWMILGFRELGRALHEWAKKIINPGSNYRALAPNVVTIEEDGKEKTISLSQVKKGDLILVDGILPVDGECESASVLLNNSLYDGQNFNSCRYNRGDPLKAGMQVMPGQLRLRLRATDSEENSNLALLDKYREEVIANKAPIQDKASRLLEFFVPVVFVLSFLSGVIVGCLLGAAAGFQAALFPLVLFCPCTLGTSIPYCIIVGIQKLGTNILVSDPSAIEVAESISSVILDLNGTLTEGKPTVAGHKIFQPTLLDNEFFNLLSGIESGSPHAFAYAIRSHRHQLGLTTEVPCFMGIETIPNQGVQGTYQDQLYVAGNAELMKKHRVQLPSINLERQTQQITYFARMGGDKPELLGYILTEEPLRRGAKQWVAELQKTRRVGICTGAKKTVALAYATELNIPPNNVYSTQDDREEEKETKKDPPKVAFIRKVQSGEKILESKHLPLVVGRQVTAMIGDGCNDSSGMLESDLGIAVSYSAAKQTQASAHVVITDDSLMSVLPIFETSKRTNRVIKQSLWFNLSFNLITLLATSVLFPVLNISLSPGWGALLMVSQSALVFLRIFWFQAQPAPKAEPSPSSVPLYSKPPLAPSLSHEEKRGLLASFDAEKTRGLLINESVKNPSPQRGEDDRRPGEDPWLAPG